MTITINRKALLDELSLLGSVIKSERTIPVLTFVRIAFDGSLARLTGTSLDTTIDTQVEAQGEAWSGCLPWKQLTALIKALDADEVTITPKGSKCEIKAGASRTLLPMLVADAFPESESMKDMTAFTVDGALLRDGLRRVLPCVTTEESRYMMQGVNFEAADGTLRLVATDGYRLSVATVPIDSDVKVTALVPADGLRALLPIEAEIITIELDTNHALFRRGERRLMARLVIGQFPNWQLIMPKTLPHKLEADSEQLSAALKRALVTRAETFKTGMGLVRGGMRFTFASDSLAAEVAENDRGAFSETLAATSNLNGESMLAIFNPDYLSDFLATGEGKFTCEFNDSNSSFLFTWASSNFKFVLMPMRI